MKPNYTRVMRTLAQHPWAVLPSTLDTICGIVEARVNGAPSFTTDEIRAQMGARAAAGAALHANGTIAVIPLVGVLAGKMNMMTNLSGGTSLDQFRSQFRRAVADGTVKSIVIAIDSPGGSVVGCDETWTEIMAARGTKPIVASVDALMASAALWIGSACDAIEMTPSGEAGSLGVYVVHEDLSEAEAAAGVKITYIASDISPFKTEGNQDEPLSDEARAYLQGRVNDVAQKFLTQVAKGRGLSAATAQKSFGGGRTLPAPQALAAKMIDRIATFEQTIARLSAPSSLRMAARAAAANAPGSNVGFVAPATTAVESQADHTDVGRGGDGQFKTQCACNDACACRADMNDGTDTCPDDCPTCDPACPCVAPAEVAPADQAKTITVHLAADVSALTAAIKQSLADVTAAASDEAAMNDEQAITAALSR